MKTIFRTPEMLARAQSLQSPPLLPPHGDILQESLFSSSRFSLWLQAQFEEILFSIPGWEESHPILLGSWARGELCPKSDLDVLFCGAESAVALVLEEFNRKSLKLRYRVPEDLKDWSKGVETFDVLALLRARPLTALGAQELFEQQKRIIQDRKNLQKLIIQDLKKERLKRAERFDSIANYLEPNLKFGSGGLRDLDQGLLLYELFSEKFERADHALSVLRFYRSFFLSIRQRLHLTGYADILVSSSQFEIAEWMGFENQKAFMKALQRGLSRVSFYSDWMMETAVSSSARLKTYRYKEYSSPAVLWKALQKDPSLLNQRVVRAHLDRCFPEKSSAKNRQNVAKILKDFAAGDFSDEFIVAVFRSRLIDKLIPEMKRLTGLVQHDQYHRYTVDTHIMQTRRELRRIKKKPRLLGTILDFLPKKMTHKDWEILGWSCFYHDIAKGLSGDHSEKGVALVDRDLKALGVAKDMIEEVQWMVRHHLEISQAAFRKNPSDPSVWKHLKEKEVVGPRLWRLALFTVVDIKATNPEAWNDWKARLLRDLLRNLESESARVYFELSLAAQKIRLKLPEGLEKEVDPLLVSALSAKALVKDIAKLQVSAQDKGSLAAHFDVFVDMNNQKWIRYFNPTNQKGLLQEAVLKIYSLGLPIRHASVHTLPDIGAWDWFMLQTQKDKKQIEKLLALPTSTSNRPEVVYQSLQWVSQNEQEWVISFKALDQSGLLADAVTALTAENCDIRSARVHTWGRQVDDVFAIVPQGDSEVLLQALKKRIKLKS